MKFIRVSKDEKVEYFINLENITSVIYYHPDDKHVEEVVINFVGNEQSMILDSELGKAVHSALKFCSQKVN